MKTNILRLVSFFSTSLAIALALVIISAMSTAKANNNAPVPRTLPDLHPSVLNGLISPTASERFLEEGRRKLETEADILVHPERYEREVILKIDMTKIKKIEEIEEKKPTFHTPEDTSQQEVN
ncbi:hypothetical protein [Mastigocoleus testarum]|nr:hypothetical protein [Mastigocoleus testarum]